MRRRQLGWSGALLVSALLASACAAGESATGVESPPAVDASRAVTTAPTAAEPTSSPAKSPLPTAPAGQGPVVTASVLRQITLDVARRTGVAAADLRVLRQERRTFSDGALGCPEPGKVYTQALVEGARVIVEAGGERFDYRISDRGDVRLCEDPGTPSGPSPRA